ncbi:hypothetical protein IAU59_001178 [Kwoniella sp. CBS 9459]
MSSHASSSRHHLRPRSARREPLVSLALTAFLPDVASLPSPISLPSKRGPSTFDSPSSPGGKARKVSRTEKDGSETIRKSKSAKELRNRYRDQSPTAPVSVGADDSAVVTPRVKHVLERDDLGTGRSPARRLFAGITSKDEHRVSGISGAIATPTHSPSGRKLAPSPPILDSPSSSRSSYASSSTSAIEIDVQAQPEYVMEQEDGDVHDCGFIIYQDDERVHQSNSAAAGENSGLRTPRSRRRTPGPDGGNSHMNVVISRAASPASSIMDMEDQENIPPPPYSSLPPYSPSKTRSQSHSAKSTPSKYSTTSSSTDDEIVSLYLSAPWTHTPSSTSGSGTRRRERSKLVNELLLLRGETMAMDQKMNVDQDNEEAEGEGEGEELTPGKKGVAVTDGRKRLALEVNMA